MSEIYQKLSAAFSSDAIQRTKKEDTKKGYDTVGIGYQFCVNRLNETLGLDGWGFDYRVINEREGAFKNGTPFIEITVEVGIWVNSKENIRRCVGGHISSSYSDALKGAITNAFKKTAAFWGVGRQAYEGTLDDDSMLEDKVSSYHGKTKPTTPSPADKTENANSGGTELMEFYKRTFLSASTEKAIKDTWAEVVKDNRLDGKDKANLNLVMRDRLSEIKKAA